MGITDTEPGKSIYSGMFLCSLSRERQSSDYGPPEGD